jgi:hypothetical protein
MGRTGRSLTDEISKSGVALDRRTREAFVRLLGNRAVPDLGWLQRVLQEDEPSILAIVRETKDLLPVERAIHRVLTRTGRTYYAQFPAPLDLYVITRRLRPRHVLESGVSSGLSSAHILAALEKNGRGRLHSIDLPTVQRGAQRRPGELSWSIPHGKGSGWAVPKRLTRYWDLRLGRTEDLLPGLVTEVPAIDLFCHDSPWTAEHLAFEFETIRPRLRSGSIVVADNTNVNPRAASRLASAFSTKVWQRASSSLVGIHIP